MNHCLITANPTSNTSMIIAAVTFKSLLRKASIDSPVLSTVYRRNFFGGSRSSPRLLMPMKAGTELRSLAIFKGQGVPTTLERSEYPDWVSDLSKPLSSLATLRKIPNEEADLNQIKRFLKLTRRQAVRQRNEESAS